MNHRELRQARAEAGLEACPYFEDVDCGDVTCERHFPQFKSQHACFRCTGGNLHSACGQDVPLCAECAQVAIEINRSDSATHVVWHHYQGAK